MSNATKLSSIKNSKLKISDQHILFVGPENINLGNVLKLMSGTPKLQATSGSKNENSDTAQNNYSTKPINFSELILDSGEKIHLIEVEHLFQMIQIKRHWTSKSLGVILFIDLASESPLEEMEKTLNDYTNHFQDLSVSIGVINNDNTTDLNLNSINQRLNKLKYKVAVFDVDINSYTEISLLVQSMLISNLYGIKCTG